MTERQIVMINEMSIEKQATFWKDEAMAWQARAKAAEEIVSQMAIAKMAWWLMKMALPAMRDEAFEKEDP